MDYTLISRRTCHLCQEAEALLAERGVVYRRLEVDEDAELKQQYTFRVPVLLKAGKVLLEGKFTPERLDKKLQEAGWTQF